MSVDRWFQTGLVVSKLVQAIEYFEPTILVLKDTSRFLLGNC
mgnify:CR=1 FL=1